MTTVWDVYYKHKLFHFKRSQYREVVISERQLSRNYKPFRFEAKYQIS